VNPEPLQIGGVAVDAPVALAPLAGITNLPFRLLAREAGCGLVYSEMVSANGLVHESPKTRNLMARHPDEGPLALQIFGAEPDAMAEGARQAQAAGADILDINFGCSVRKILRSGAGSALMRDLPRSAAILRAVREAVTIPLTIKIRSGWDDTGRQALELARIAQDSGVDAIAVHPRTAKQGFSGHSDWSIIARVREAVDIPVIGNGDVIDPEDAARMRGETGCDLVMVGRAAIGRPWLFGQIRDRLAGGEPKPAVPTVRFAAMRRYLRESIAHIGEEHGSRIMRSRLGWFARGLPHAARFRDSITRIASESEALERIAEFEARVLAREAEEPVRISA
jgi:nifR3 family TIM-barrel protein